jgi:hypothetical protein
MKARTKLSLDGTWNFWADPANLYDQAGLNLEEAIKIRVPSPWQSQAPELRYYSGAAWYQRDIDISTDFTAGRIIYLGIDASDYCTEVWLNGQKVGKNEGGYLPFELDVTSAVKEGINSLVIRVDDPPGIFPEIPHGKQSWYGPLSGLWQSVWIESRAPRHIRSINVYPDLNNQIVTAQVELFGSPNGPCIVRARIIAPSGEVVRVGQVPAPFRGTRANLTIAVPDPTPWSLDHPHLYQIEVAIENGHAIDAVSKKFGFRTIETSQGKLFLNGEPVYLRGALDQDYYLESICTSPDDNFLEDQIKKAKELGFNCLRCHIKVADPRYYDAADRLGMLIWTELPNWSTLTESSRLRGRETLKGILERDGHHPSIIIWTIINEDWGTELVDSQSDRIWLKETYRWLKALDPSRLVVDNSACEPNFHIQTDIEDYHFYRAIPDHRREWDAFVEAFACRADFTFSPGSEKVRSGQEPLIVSEFGNWGLPDVALLKDEQGHDPWWFETGFDWSEGVVFPQGVLNRFNNLGLKQIFGSWQDFAAATQWQQYQALKYQIESMRRRCEIAGYVVTELTDVHWECNGLLDMQRNPRVFHHLFRTINADTVIIPDWERVTYRTGEEVCVGLIVSHAAGADCEGSRLSWRVSQDRGIAAAEGCIPLPPLKVGAVNHVGTANFAVPPVETPSVWTLKMEMVSQDEKVLATNHMELFFHPPVRLSENLPLVYSSDSALSSGLAACGMPIANSRDQAQVVVTGRVDDDQLAYLQSGGRLLVLADLMGAEGTVLPGVKLAAREDTPWDGDWASTFAWLDRRSHYAALPGGPLIDHSFDNLIPDYVLTGFRDWEFPALVRSGIVVGWVHKPAALIGERWYGKGKAVITTFRLEPRHLSQDPTASQLLVSLIQHAAAERS